MTLDRSCWRARAELQEGARLREREKTIESEETENKIEWIE